ncbi:hypothetical protein K469DRAFT_309521 [Zopfia rhizophila CBS 207.26]|uniref:Secreted protein n=1 Tax=Zopfia rhizophila CBS 207.26 TaxID=1314779 RepID=A0A6A6ENN2_9PEZI|nr:hypothetical protein K469DRAFT_309521 [Zopfia rhizophila CBS 207.26]
MKPQFLIFTALLSSALASLMAGPGPICTTHVVKAPSFQVDCTFYSHTMTKTSYTDCGGCALETKYLGRGLVRPHLSSFPRTSLPYSVSPLHPLH